MLIHSIMYVYQIHNRYVWLCYVILIILIRFNQIISPAFGQLHVPFCFVHLELDPGFAVFHVPRGGGGVRLPALPAGAPQTPMGDTMVDVGDVHVERGPWHGVEKTAFILGGWELFKVGRLLLTFAIWPSLLTLLLVHSLYILILLIFCQSWRSSSLGGASVSKDSPFFGTSICQKVD